MCTNPPKTKEHKRLHGPTGLSHLAAAEVCTYPHHKRRPVFSFYRPRNRIIPLMNTKGRKDEQAMSVNKIKKTRDTHTHTHKHAQPELKISINSLLFDDSKERPERLSRTPGTSARQPPLLPRQAPPTDPQRPTERRP